MGFNPQNLISLDTLGTVYQSLRITDQWGILKVIEGGALMSKDWKYVLIPAQNIEQENSIIKGDGWELSLNRNWKLIKNNKNYSIEKTD